MPDQIPYIRVFISSPGDVNAERKIALDVIDYFPNRPAYREKVAFRVVAWDKPGAGTAMLGTLTPQEAINRGLPKPSECDIVVVIFWSRMGTPFTDTDGTEYLSGTHWEMLDALNSDRPETIIFRRREEKLFKSSDKKGREQYDRVEDFFKSELFYREDGSIVRGVNKYNTPDDFRRDFEIFFEELVVRLLERYDKGETQPPPQPPAPDTPQAKAEAENIRTVEADIWDGSPFPGLRAFTEADAPIFFGRGRETDALVNQLENSRFVAVVGASGSGKSSLVAAGLIPRLKANVIEGSADWLYARFTPGSCASAFEALSMALIDAVPALAVHDPIEYPDLVEKLTSSLSKDSNRFTKTINHALKDFKRWVQLVLFIDQFEELFTLTDADETKRFAALLTKAVESERIRVIVTMRHDFYHRAVEIPDLAELLRADAVFSLAAPRRDALQQMIERPAILSGIEFEQLLVERILDDTGDSAGALALLAYLLDEIYHLSVDDARKTILVSDYVTLGGVNGAIGKRAHSIFERLSDNEKVTLIRMFRHLLTITPDGTPTRKRAAIDNLAVDNTHKSVLDAFISARLLVANTDIDNEMGTVEVAHEALFSAWPHLSAWIRQAKNDLSAIEEMRRGAAIWERNRFSEVYLWSDERLRPVYQAIMNLGLDPTQEFSQVEVAFLMPESERLLRELNQVDLPHKRRLDIGNRLGQIGDKRKGISIADGKPQFEWCKVSSQGEIVVNTKSRSDGKQIENQETKHRMYINPFYISKYQVTVGQYDIFLQSEQGYQNERWWAGMPAKYIRQEFKGNDADTPTNYPRDWVSWYQSIAFARWVNELYVGSRFKSPSDDPKDSDWIIGENAEIRVPTEQEWRWAAQNGTENRDYPWGQNRDSRYANTRESDLGQSVAVGMYPHGAAVCGALDMTGNLYEWCLNKYDDPSQTDMDTSNERRVLKGGTFDLKSYIGRCSSRSVGNPGFSDVSYGLRLVIASKESRK